MNQNNETLLDEIISRETISISRIEKIKILAGNALNVSKLSKDPSTKVGAIILNQDLGIVSEGYNGFARGVKDTKGRWYDRELKYKLVIHAEENAILTANGSLENHILINTHFPCPLCASRIIQKKISEVYYINPMREDHFCELSKEIFDEVGVKYYRLKNL